MGGGVVGGGVVGGGVVGGGAARNKIVSVFVVGKFNDSIAI